MPRLPLPVLCAFLGTGLGLGLSAAARAGTQARTQDLPSVCQQLIQEKAVIRAGEPSVFKLLLKLIFDRGSFVSPNLLADQTNQAATALADRGAGSGMNTGGEIRIFTLGHPEAVSATVSAHDKAILEVVRAEEKRQLQAINRILKTKTASECVAEARKISWSPDQLDALQSLEDSALQATRREESRLSLQAAQKAAGNPEAPRFTIVPVDSWGEILQSLRSNPAPGMILIAHADSTGRLYDSLRDELPSGFFRALPASVRFIGVFSCESAQVVQAYSLDRLADADREVVTVKLGAPFDAAATTPIQLFPTWVEKLEKEKLFDSIASGSGPAPAPEPEAECPISLEGLQLRQGRVAVTIRGLPAGIWSSGNETETQLVPCSWLEDPATLSVFVEPSQLGENVIFGSMDFSARLAPPLPSPALSLASEQIYETGSGLFRSAILRMPSLSKLSNP